MLKFLRKHLLTLLRVLVNFLVFLLIKKYVKTCGFVPINITMSFYNKCL